MKTIVLSAEEVTELCEIMTAGSIALKQCAEVLGMKHNVFRGQLFGNKLDNSNLTPEQRTILENSIPLIMAVRNKCEDKMIKAFYPMAVRQARTIASRASDPHEVYKDILQDSQIGILDATYSFENGKGMALKNYVWKCIRRKIVAGLNHSNPFCQLTNEATDLIIKVEVERAKGHSDYVTDYQITQILGFTPEQQQIYFGATLKMVNEVTEEEAHSDDYTANRRGVDNDINEIILVRKDMRQALKDASLDEFELTCLFYEAFPSSGWKTYVAKDRLNPNTGKPYTRQNMHLMVTSALARAKQKVKAAYSNPPVNPKENPLVDKLLNELSGQFEGQNGYSYMGQK